MQLIKYPRSADRLRQVVTVEVGLQLSLYMSKHQFDFPAGKFRLKFLNDAGSAVVHICNRAGVYQHPTHQRSRIRSDKVADLIGEPAGVGVEKGRSETVDHQTGLGYSARNGRGQTPDFSFTFH